MYVYIYIYIYIFGGPEEKERGARSFHSILYDMYMYVCMYVFVCYVDWYRMYMYVYLSYIVYTHIISGSGASPRGSIRRKVVHQGQTVIRRVRLLIIVITVVVVVLLLLLIIIIISYTTTTQTDNILANYCDIT